MRLRVMQVLEATAGGTRRHLEDIVELLGRDVELHLAVAVRRDPDFQNAIGQFRRDGIQVSVVPMRRTPSPWHDLISYLRLRQLLRDFPCDVLHLHSARAGWFGRLVAHGFPCHVMYTPHAFPFLQTGLIGPLSWLGEKLVSPLTGSLVAVCEAEKTVATKHRLVAPERVRVIQNAVDASALRRQMGEMPALRDAAQGRVFGFIGELRTQKDPVRFIEAASELRQRGISARFVMPAAGPMLPRVQNLVKERQLTDAVEFVSPRDRLRELYRRIDIAVLPSLWEGLPYTLLEAFAVERPVITSNLPAFRELIGRIHPALICPDDRPCTLADRMAWWLAQPNSFLLETAARGRRYVERHHGMSQWRSQMLEAYHSACEVRPTSAAMSRAPKRAS